MSIEGLTMPGIIMDSEEGLISFCGERMLMFPADALRQLKVELIKTLGFDLARGILTRLGYHCGYNDAQSIKPLFNLDLEAEWMLAGPKIHTLEGLINVDNEILDYNREAGLFYMRGRWKNSYEAQEYLMSFDSSNETVCWTLAGYASGYCSRFFGSEVVCVETKCVAKGDPYCQYEIKAKDKCDGKGDGHLQDLEPNEIVKGLQHMLNQEKERLSQWKVLSEIALYLSKDLDFDERAKNFYQYVSQLVSAKKVFLIIKEPGSKLNDIYGYVLGAAQVVNKQLDTATGILANLLDNGATLIAHGEKLPRDFMFVSRINEFIGVPLVSKGSQLGSLIVANKLTDHGFSEYDRNILTLLGIQIAKVIENKRLFMVISQELERKNAELNRVNEFLRVQQKSSQKSFNLHDHLAGLVIENSGLQKIVTMIGQAIGLPVWIEDEGFGVLAKTRVSEKIQQISSRELFADFFENRSLEGFYSKKEVTVFQTVDKNGNTIKRGIMPIIASKEILGFLTVDLTLNQLSEEQNLILRDASIVIALEILKQKVLIDNKKRLKKNLLDEWLFSKTMNEEQVQDWVFKLELTLDFPLNILVLEFEGTGIGQISKCVNEIMNVLPPNGVLGSHENKLVVILGKGSDNLITSIKNKLISSLHQYTYLKWWLTIGAKSNSIMETRQKYNNACSVNQMMKNLNKDNTCFDYRDLGIYGMLGIEPERFTWFARKVLGQVMDYDKKHNSELISTLRLYFESNQNIQAASRRGYVNDGTIKYRLKRIQEISNMDLTNPEITLQVQLALKFI
ncbi:XylR N-terminal domain-containing protein [Desulfosporosinus lacus]|uniref:V4R domain-containing protein n=1 Tax=Desulfosporosinus lacus DSM 15449 TaxID=1121420 RepID=A0A1M5Z0F3_9FIRM|nr:XylR N-terminal domain-containing protein [Desulfosporosinus lacus]SHI17772.1 V4R domain-containing protein [Desulfosporosinus lacus DSM 15449]